MIHLTDQQIDALIDFGPAIPVLEDAFRQLGRGNAAVQRRVRTEAGATKLSTLGAVLPGADVAGAKVYTTLRGQFSFAIILFRASDGQLLATLDANAITRLRTAATTTIAVRALAKPGARTAAIFGTGVQGRAHAHALAQFTDLKAFRIVGIEGAAALADELNAAYGARGVEAREFDAAGAIDGADVIVTATRATGPLFDGSRVTPGALIAAIGSSLPHTRELDDTTVARAARIVVELTDQAREEAGDLLLAAPGIVDWNDVVELGAVLEGKAPGRRRDDDIVLYEALGIGLQDVAVAALAYRAFVARQ
ncbi:ornithine cyclodeaminase family protein [Paraburkholderia caballeronis]|uniref:Ornithine cyclodeaminase n=1 Tax=Paraburkholderia caballeronis TaxID=416943 RepID=A0A1H7RT61_9BURK|nr:ornithine cyclodeaminase family protein [Paraburkholderia caballeronis]PXW23202.1 ornithine cyclodeaminase [Paraburkholderia caballeronis]PXW97866.1 ornithine cyclodeaminase [Paraburkholderia caballeronis]RAJ94836.1 ornithine cyclodeaminase [Paraburkholderia caballeronis]SEE63395.1 ornithine cyclodeaminase [Paraburkholderia caballeronis]SEL63470.1 ornithine cyclodeaminase [Paraburkholderia caballeronis]